MTLLDPEIGKTITVVGAIAEAIGLPLAILDYGWHQKAHNVQQAINNFANAPFKSLWTRIFNVYSGDKPILDKNNKTVGYTHGDVTIVGGLFSCLGIAVGIWVGRRAGSIGLGVAATVGACLIIGYGAPLLVILVSRMLRPLATLSNGRPVGLFGVLLACVGLVVSLYHVLEILVG
jgi:hypothetical protein